MTDIRALYRHMLRIRRVEESIAANYADQNMRCPVHLSIGQEGPAAAFAVNARQEDYAVSTHRAHAHFLAKGGNLRELIAELHGKFSGCSKGVGGSMHLADKSVGFMGSSAIVGNSLPVGVGLGLSLQLQGKPGLSCVFLGDGATEEGVYYESVNFSVLKNLPVLFICENNGFSVYSDESVRRPPNQTITEVAASLGLRTELIDGNDVVQCSEALGRAMTSIRGGAGPMLLEFTTFRQREHCGPNFDDELGYRDPAYLDYWSNRDPLVLAEAYLSSDADREWIQQQEAEISREIDDAFQHAREARFITLEECRELVYA